MSSPNPVEALRTQFKNLRRLYFLFLILAVLALVLYFIQPWLTLGFLGASLVLNIFVGRKKSKEYVRSFTHLCAQISLERHLQNAVHTHKPALKEADLRQARMLPTNAASGGVVCHEGATGTYRGRHVVLGDTTLAHTYTLGGKKRHNFTVGTWITIDLESDTGLDCRFIGENTTPEQSLTEMLWVESDLKRQPLPSSLKNLWRVLTPESNTVLPGDAFLKQLDKLHKKADGRVAACVQGDKLHIMLIGDILAQKISSRVAPGPGFEQADLIPNLPYALMLSDTLVK